MITRSKRFYEVGVLARALEDPEERASLKKFFKEDLLPSSEVEERIRTLFSKLLHESHLDGSEDSFQLLAAKNKLAIEDLNRYLRKILDPHGEGETSDHK